MHQTIMLRELTVGFAHVTKPFHRNQNGQPNTSQENPSNKIAEKTEGPTVTLDQVKSLLQRVRKCEKVICPVG